MTKMMTRLRAAQIRIADLRSDAQKEGGNAANIVTALSAALAWLEEAEKALDFDANEETVRKQTPEAEFFKPKRQPIPVQYWGRKNVPPKST